MPIWPSNVQVRYYSLEGWNHVVGGGGSMRTEGTGFCVRIRVEGCYDLGFWHLILSRAMLRRCLIIMLHQVMNIRCTCPVCRA